MAEPTTPVKTPEWLLLLEKKKTRPHRLAHEIGAGSPCLVCGEKCPGLDLHFWRKLCRNCKCKKEDHDVKDDDGYEQFEILLGAGARKKKLGAVLKIKVPEVSNDSVKAVVEKGNKNVPFDWVPPNVTEEIAAEYMGQLPSAKLPISGSDGALYRKQQLERQMPLHDLDATRCHNLTPHEIEELQKYVDNMKNNVVGQGRVTKVPMLYIEQRLQQGGPVIGHTSLLPSSRSEQSLKSMPPLPPLYKATPFLPRQKSDVPALPLSTTLPSSDIRNKFRTPSSFVPHNILRDNISSDYSLSHKYQGLDQHVAMTLTNQIASDISRLQLGETGRYHEASHPCKDGIKLPYQLPSNLTHSSQVSGQQTPGSSQALQGRINVNQSLDNSATSRSTALDKYRQHEGKTGTGVIPQHGSVVHSIHCQSVTSSVPGAGSLAADISHPLPAQSAPLPCNCGASSVEANQVLSDPKLRKLDNNEQHEGKTGAGVIPQHGSVVHSIHCQSVTSSVPGAGSLAAHISHPLPAQSAPLPCNCGASSVEANQVLGDPKLRKLDNNEQHEGKTGAGVIPQHGSVVHSIHCQSVTSSVPGAGSLAAHISHPLPAQSAPLPCNCGASSVEANQVLGDPKLRKLDNNEQHEGKTGAGVIPQHGSFVHSIHCQSVTSSVPGAGSLAADISHPLPAQSAPLPCNCGASSVEANQVLGDPKLRKLDNNEQHEGKTGAGVIPQHGSVVHSIHCQSVTSSVPGAGSLAAHISHPLPAQSAPLPCNCGALNMQSLQPYGTASSTSVSGLLNAGMSEPAVGTFAAISSNYDGLHSNELHNFASFNTIADKNAPSYAHLALHEGKSLEPNYVPVDGSNSNHSGILRGNNSSVVLNKPVQLQHSNETWDNNTGMPAPAHYEHGFQRGDISYSSNVSSDSMPRSAHVIQQSRPDNNAPAYQLNHPAQEQNVKSHLTCHHCKEGMMAGDVAVFADRAGDDTAWHPKCFVCKTCNELLVDLIYFFTKGNVYCGRHFAELLNVPRCYACDELIFVKEHTVAEEKTFHVKHFCCYECDEPLAGKQYVPVDDQPVCVKCYQETFGKHCNTCKKQIPPGERRIGWMELSWHVVGDCFSCHGCKKSLLGGKFVMKDQQPYCNKDCVQLVQG